MKKVDSDKLCSVCMSKPINTVCVPCGHRCVCNECANDLRARNKISCIICRKKVDTFVKTFDS